MLDLYEAGLLAALDLKLRGRMGHGENDIKEIRLLNRIIRLEKDGLLYEADPRHAELLGRALGLEEARPVPTPGVKNAEDIEHGSELNEPLPEQDSAAPPPHPLDYEQRLAHALQQLHPEPRVPSWAVRT